MCGTIMAIHAIHQAPFRFGQFFRLRRGVGRVVYRNLSIRSRVSHLRDALPALVGGYVIHAAAGISMRSVNTHCAVPGLAAHLHQRHCCGWHVLLVSRVLGMNKKLPISETLGPVAMLAGVPD